MWSITPDRAIPVLVVTLSAAVLLWVVYAVVMRVVDTDTGRSAGQTARNTARAGVPEYRLQDIIDAHLFGQPPARAPQPVAAPRTRLQLTLAGMIASNDPRRAIALIASNNGPSNPYRIGDAIKPSGAVVRSIEPTKVIIERAGRLESLYIDRPTVDNPGEGTPGRTAPDATQRMPKGTAYRAGSPMERGKPNTNP